MNQTIEQLYNRKSVRVFTDQKISKEIEEEILEAAFQAPTAGNQQLYTILKISDENIKKELCETCDHQSFIAQGQLVLVFLADCKKWYDAYNYGNCNPRKPGVGDLLLAVDDALIAAQNAVVAAESYGIGSCYIGDVMENYERQRELLNLPEYVFPAALLVFGYPTQQQKDRVKPLRQNKKYIVQENTYQELKEEELKDMLSNKCDPTLYDSWIQAFCTRKYNSEFSKEMTRSVQKYLDQFEG
ncbi:nitroreductase family protein [Floccifex sp.]|uniref:nitroreductase family protein n=1 Tax=Floccifex sp. TaxID=2815810 RepID=UPI003F08277E